MFFSLVKNNIKQFIYINLRLKVKQSKEMINNVLQLYKLQTTFKYYFMSYHK